MTRKLPPLVVCIAVVTLLLLAGGAIAGDAPKIACKQPVYEFGVVDNSQFIEHTFVIWNEGEASLQISRVRPCCGATAEITDKTILPGTNTALKTKLSLRGRKGKQQKSFYIASNDPKQPYYQLQLIGTAVATVDVQPQSVNFRQILSDAVVEREVTIVCETNFAFRITNIVSTVTQFAATYKKAGSNSHHVTIMTVPPLLPGVTRGEVLILTDNAKSPQIDIPIIATVSSDILVVPREILFGETDEKPTPITRYVVIRSRSKRTFKILKVEPPEPKIEVKLSPFGSGSYRCELRNIIPSPNLNGSNIVITTDHEDAKEIVIPVRVVSPKDPVEKESVKK